MTVKTTAQLNADITAKITSTPNSISAQDIREIVQDIVDSTLIKEDRPYRKLYVETWSDFDVVGNRNHSPFVVSSASGGSFLDTAMVVTTNNKQFGVFGMLTGTDVSGLGRSCLYVYGRNGTVEPYNLGYYSGSLFEVIGVRVTALPLTGNDYVVRCGFLDSITTAEPVDGVYFELNITSNQWYICTANNNTRTKQVAVHASLSPVVADTEYNLKAEINSSNTSVTFYIDQGRTNTWLNVGTITTNIPTGTGRDVGKIISISKITGTTSIGLYVDGWYDRMYVLGRT